MHASSPLRIFFSHGSNLPAALTCLALALGCVMQGSLPWTAVLCGVVVFLVEEYFIHRFLLHAPPAPWAWLREGQRRIHTGHHLEPDNLALVFLPPLVVAPLVVLHAWIYHALGFAASPLLVGNLLGFLYYEWVHLIAHLPVTPRTAYGRFIKRCHLLHHFKNEHFWFGVTSPTLDVLFGTWRAASEVERSPTARVMYP